jgi:hypothetical protein
VAVQEGTATLLFKLSHPQDHRETLFFISSRNKKAAPFGERLVPRNYRATRAGTD